MKTKLFFLTILFSFSFSNIKAQCPSGDVQLLSQEEIDAFVATYPNCTHLTGDLLLGEFLMWSNNINDVSGFINLNKIDGELKIGGSNLVNLNGFNNLTEVGGFGIANNLNLTSISELINLTKMNGNLQVGNNPELISLQGLNNIEEIQGFLRIVGDNDNLHSFSGLNNLKTIGGSFDFSQNNINSLEGLENLEYIGGFFIIIYTNLTNLDLLNNLTHVGGYMYIADNEYLTNLQGISNVVASEIGDGEFGLLLVDNVNLSNCHIPNICEYLSFDSTEYPRVIYGNTGNCTDEQAVLAACGLGINDMENDSANWNVHYQKNTGGFLIQTIGFKMSDIEVYDLSGKLLKSAQNLNSDREEIRVFTPETILIIKVKTQEGKSFAKKVMMK